MGEISRRSFLQGVGAVLGGGALTACGVRTEKNLIFKDEEGREIKKGSEVRWTSRGVYGPGDDSNRQPRGAETGTGKVLGLKRVKNYSGEEGKNVENIWARVEYEREIDGEFKKERAWHLIDTLDVVENEDK